MESTGVYWKSAWHILPECGVDCQYLVPPICQIYAYGMHLISLLYANDSNTPFGAKRCPFFRIVVRLDPMKTSGEYNLKIW